MERELAFIGAGNVGFRLALALAESGLQVGKVYTRTSQGRERLVKALNSLYRSSDSSLKDLPSGQLSLNQSLADTRAAGAVSSIAELSASGLIIISVNDSSIRQVAEELASTLAGGQHPMVVHTSGAVALSALDPLRDRGCATGVLYPLMSLNRHKDIDFHHVPFLLESSDERLSDCLNGLCDALGSEHYFFDSQKRAMIHLGATFTSNFINYILGLAFPICQKEHPLLISTTLESVRNAFLQSPASSLTGPARRGDMTTIRKHLDLLKTAGLQEQEEIYRLFTEKILATYHPELAEELKDIKD